MHVDLRLCGSHLWLPKKNTLFEAPSIENKAPPSPKGMELHHLKETQGNERLITTMKSYSLMPALLLHMTTIQSKILPRANVPCSISVYTSIRSSNLADPHPR